MRIDGFICSLQLSIESDLEISSFVGDCEKNRTEERRGAPFHWGLFSVPNVGVAARADAPVECAGGVATPESARFSRRRLTHDFPIEHVVRILN